MISRQANAMLFTKRLFLFVILGTASIFVVKGIYSLGSAHSQESSSQERQFKIKEFNDMPLEVKVKNLQSKTWHRDLEIEVKNISGRPIYFILASLEFPDDTPPRSGDKVGFSLRYGKPENIRISHLADPEDEHLDPEKTHVFKIPEPIALGFEDRHKQYPGVDKNLEFKIALVSYGDGTGWEFGAPRDKRKKSASALELPYRGAKKKETK